MRFSPFDFYLIYNCIISKHAADSARSFYGFGLENSTDYREEKFKKNTKGGKPIEVHCNKENFVLC